MSRGTARQRALVGALGVLGCVLLVAWGFLQMRSQGRESAARLLDQALHARIALVDDAVADARADGKALAQSADIIAIAVAQARKPSTVRGSDDRSMRILRDLAGGRFSAIQVVAADGRIVAHWGDMVPTSDADVRLDSELNDALLWNHGLVVHTRGAIQSPTGQYAGFVAAERSLADLTVQTDDLQSLGATARLAICATSAPGRMACFPDTALGESIVDAEIPAAAPIGAALQGVSGTIEAQDARQKNVLAARAPSAVGPYAFAIQQDLSEIDAPVRNRLFWAVPIIAAFLTIGMLLFRPRQHAHETLAARLHREQQAHAAARTPAPTAAVPHDEVAAIIGGIADGLLTIDSEGRVAAANPAAARLFGREPADLVGQDFNALLPPEFRLARSSGMRAYVGDKAQRDAGRGIPLVGLRGDGSEFPMEVTVSAIAHPRGERHVVVVRDATARQKAGQALLLEKERLRVTLHSIADAVITTDIHGVITFMNPVAESLTGWHAAETLGLRIDVVYAIVHPESGDFAPNPVDVVLSTGALGGMSTDTVLMRRDGSKVDVEDSASPIRDPDGSIVGVVLVFRDATQARRLTGHIHHQATHDALTDLVNRREFERQLAATLAGEGPQGQGHVLLFIDLDQFKIVNDTAGHAAGDKLLKQVAGLLRSCLRSSDQLARMGGDEFAVLLRNCPVEPGIRVAESLRQVVADLRYDWEGTLFRIGASIGLVQFEAGASLSQILSEADSACYLAKDKGRNRIYVHHAGDEDVVRRSGELNWTSRIHAALADDRFELYAQKIAPVSAARGKDQHFELLVRMRDEHAELVPPMAFIPAAERYGLMPAIDRWVVAHALESLALARARGATDLLFSINLSGATLGDDTFADFVEDQFHVHRVPHARVCFEITETAAISNLIQAGRFIGRLRQLGCKFSLDDFGTGMSSFTYLKHLPVDFLKIDGSFIRNIVRDDIDAAMADAINRVGHVMGIKTVAEFVEDDATLQRLRFIGVDFAQGFAIEAPRPIATVIPDPDDAKDNLRDLVAKARTNPASRIQGSGTRWNAG